MKKKLMVVLVACVLALALPCIAFAIPSGAVSGDTAKTVGKDAMGNKAELEFTAEGADWVKIVPVDYTAKNYAIPEGEQVVGQQSYEITASRDDVKVTLVYTTDESLAGLKCYVFVEHNDGTCEPVMETEVGPDGKVTYNMDRLSAVTFSVTKAVEEKDNGGEEGGTTPAPATDSKSTSPKTGIVK